MTNPFLSLAVLDTNDAKHRPYCAQIRSQGSHGRICPFPPPPFPMAGKGLGWAGKCRAAVRHSGYVRACKNCKPPTLKYLFIHPLVPLL